MLNVPPSAIAPYFIVRDYAVSGNFGSTTKIVSANINRVSITFSAVTGNATIWYKNQFPAIGGMIVPLNAAPTIFKFSDVGVLVGSEWWLGQGSGFSVLVIEVIFSPPTE